MSKNRIKRKKKKTRTDAGARAFQDLWGVSATKVQDIFGAGKPAQRILSKTQKEAAELRKRGLNKETALIVAKELTMHDALGTHIRDELGINEISQAKPMQAAFASLTAFTTGGLLPLLVTLFLPLKSYQGSA